MRKFIIAALAATVIMPAAAGAQGGGEVRDGQREVRQDRRELVEHQSHACLTRRGHGDLVPVEQHGPLDVDAIAEPCSPPPIQPGGRFAR